MPRKQKKYHYIYKTTNVKNGKYYIGMHSTDDLNDGYIGSGKRLWNSINYHGKDNHVCEILEYCKDREDLIKREEEIVNSDLLNEDLCMILCLGGTGGNGGFTIEMQILGGLATSKILNERFTNDVIYREKMKKLWSETAKKTHSLDKIKTGKDAFDWTDKKHSEETKLKISEAKKGKNVGKNNSQFGSCWITNEIDNKKIKRGDLIPEGWRLGRTIKK